MIDLDGKFKTALKTHQSGDLAQAKILYEAILKQNPQHADTMHLLGVLAAQLGQFDVSTDWIQHAIAIKPDVPLFHNNFGNALKATGQLKEAEIHYRKALQLNSDYAEAHNNLASILFKQNNISEALQHYVEAIRLQPDYLEAHVNLGLLFLRQNQIEAAIKQFSNAINLQPDFIPAHLQLGNLYLTCGELDKAINHYQIFLKHEPQHVETLNNLGVAYLKQNKFTEAARFFQQALAVEPKHADARNNLAATFLQQDRFTEANWHYQLYLQLAPDDTDAHYNFAVAAMALGNLKDAIEHFKHTLELTPNHVDAHCNLAAIYLKTGKKDQAIDHYQQAVALQPENVAASYLLGALTKNELPSAAPAEYIKQLFDNYAGYFDKQLIEHLHYQTPSLMRTALTKFLPAKKPKWQILDLGCGTGLAGAAFRDLAKCLIGVDLSPRMLEKAREKALYDELIEEDLTNFLATTKTNFDLIISADTLVYIGDLTAVIEGCYRALHEHGLAIFSTELSTGQTYELETSGRFAHTKSYIEKLAIECGFKVLTTQKIIGRYQQSNPVDNIIYILQK